MNNPPIEYYPRLLIIDSKLTRTLMHIKLKTIVYNLPTDQRMIFKRFKMTRKKMCRVIIVHKIARSCLTLLIVETVSFFPFS